MIKFSEYVLKNGLKVISHYSKKCEMAALNIIYNVGSKDEDGGKTGLAHLLEHLMFGGSKNIACYDEVIQNVGGSNNAYTSEDVTNYHCIMPVSNIETGFWAESDRMMSLKLDNKSLEIQKNVVIEEFKEVYLNKPYGEIWLKIKELAYENHAYRWPVIGKEISHIESMELEDVQDFFLRFYSPKNAILLVSGGVEPELAIELSEKWFCNIEPGSQIVRKLNQEANQEEGKLLELSGDVPAPAICKAFHSYPRLSREFYATLIIVSILSEGTSSRLYQNLVDKEAIFSEINAFNYELIESGLIVVKGIISPQYSIAEAEKRLNNILYSITNSGISEIELEKAKNNYITSTKFSYLDLLTRTETLAFYSILGNPNLINEETEKINSLSKEEIENVAKSCLQPQKCSTIHYYCK